MTRTMLAALALGAAVAFAGPASADKMKVTLDGKSEVPPNASAGTGTAPTLHDHFPASWSLALFVASRASQVEAMSEVSPLARRSCMARRKWLSASV